MSATGSSTAMRRPLLFTPQAHKSAPRTTSTAALSRSMQPLTPAPRQRSGGLTPFSSSSPHDQENRAGPQLPPAYPDVVVRHTPVKVDPAFESPSSASSASIRSSFASLSPSSSVSTSSQLLLVSPRHPLSLRSPNVPSLTSSCMPRVLVAVDKAQAKPAAKFQKPTHFHARAKRTSPPSSAQPLPRVKKPSPSTLRPHLTASGSTATSQAPARAVGRPSSSSPRLRSQLQSLESALCEEREKVKALTAELARLRGELADERRKGGVEETDEVVGQYWHPVAAFDFYAAVNSAASSASASESEGEVDDEDEGEEEEEEEGNSVQADELSAGVSHAENGEEEDDEEDGDDEADEEGGSSVSTTPDRWSRHSTSTVDDDLAQHMAITTLSPALPRPVISNAAIRHVSALIEDVHPTHPESAESDHVDDEGDDVDDSSHRSASASSAASTASSHCSLSSSPNFSDVFPYERNLYLLSRHYHFQHRLYSCPDAVTFKALHIRTGAAVVIKVSEGFSPSRSHPKEVRLLTRAQGHPNVMTLRGWYGLQPTRCYAFVTDFVPNVGIDAVWEHPHTRRTYLHDLLRGLAHLHARGILYRDVKPSNVLWEEREGKAVIIDFDVATYFDKRRLHRSVVGTTGFMAPEMLKLDEVGEEVGGGRGGGGGGGEGYGQEVDVYSAGVVLGQMLFRIHEDEVADPSRPETKGPAMVDRVLRWAHQHGGRIGAEYHLLLRMLTSDPLLRITVKDALQHPYFTQQASA